MLDLTLPAEPPTSEEVLRERLGLLGLGHEAVESALGALDPARGFGDVLGDEDLRAFADLAPLGELERAKLAELARAYLSGEPVTFVGLEPSDEERAEVPVHVLRRRGDGEVRHATGSEVGQLPRGPGQRRCVRDAEVDAGGAADGGAVPLRQGTGRRRLL